MKKEFPKDLTGLRFGYLTVVGRYPGKKSDNSLWVCHCTCGEQNCKRFTVMRRGLLTRNSRKNLSCGAKNNGISGNAKTASETKLFTGIAQKNSKTQILGVSPCSTRPWLFRARIDVFGKRLEKSGLSLRDAILVRDSWEQMKKAIILEDKNARPNV